MQSMFQDLRYALRTLWKSPGFTLITVFTLALGIGVNSAIFSVVNSLLIRPLPYTNANQLVMVWENLKKDNNPHNAVAPANFVDWKEQNKSFEHMAAFTAPVNYNFTGGAVPERVVGARVSAGFFQMLGVQPVQGRLFNDEEDQPNNNLVIIISHSLWQRRFGSDMTLIGKTFNLSERTFKLVGILPANFRMPPDFQLSTLDNVEVWTPLALSPEGRKRRTSHSFNVVARLKSSNVSLRQAQTEMDAIGQNLQEQYPATNKGWGVTVNPLREEFVGHIRPVLLILFGAVCFVLLIACVNVANLLLVRSNARRSEMAMRAALGATRGRMVRQLLTESVMLSLIGGVLGCLVAVVGVRALVAFSPTSILRIREVSLDRWVLGYTLLISLVTGVLFGLAPAFFAWKAELTETLKEGGRGGGVGSRSNRLHKLLVVVETALAVMLLIGAGLMVRSFLQLQNVDPGFNAHNVLTMQVALPSLKYKTPEEAVAFYDQAIQRLESLPGVEAAAKVSELPFSGDQFDNAFSIEGRPPQSQGEKLQANLRLISNNYFRAMGIPTTRGRAFTSQDAQAKPAVVIINEAMARRFWPNEDPLGKRLTIDLDEPGPREIVGVVKDIRHYSLDVEPRPEMYVPNLALSQNIMSLVLRSTTDPTSLVPAVRQEVLSLDSNQPVYNVKTMEEMVGDSVATQRFSMLMLGCLAAVALILAIVGIYGVIAYWVAQRSHEMGVRIALGARSRDILKMILVQSMTLALVGVGIGLIAAFILTRVMSTLLFGVSARDPLAFLVAALLLAAVAFVAALVPARKATKVDPMCALRNS
jgi:putative ABC transport system permease protein